MPGKRWTQDQIDGLRRLWPLGKTSVAIGEILGVSDKAVRRQACTLGLARRPSGGGQRQTAKRAPKAPLKGLPTLADPYTPKDVWGPLPDSKPVDIMGLTPTTCRWPLADDLYCGAHTDKTYCAGHHAIAFRATPKAPGTVDGRLRRRRA